MSVRPLVPVLAVSALLAPAPAAPRAGDTFESPELGFRLELPEGWGHREQTSAAGFELIVFPRGEGSGAQLSLRVNPTAAVSADPEQVRRQSVDLVEAGGDQYGDLQLFEVKLLGREAPALRVDATTGGQRIRLRQIYLAEHGNLYVLRGMAPAAQWEEWVERFDGVWGGLSFIELELDDEDRERRSLEAIAARCGSELDWADGWQEAAERARESGRLIMVLARMTTGFKIADSATMGPFMRPDVAEIVNARYVPMQLRKGEHVPFEDPDVYGMGPYAFGTSLLLVTPEGEVLAESSTSIYPLLLEGVALNPLPAPEGEGLERAAAHLARGELASAEALLSDPTTAQGWRLRASLERRRREGPEALSSIRMAREAPGAAAIAGHLDADEGLVLMRLGRFAAARDAFETFLVGHPSHARAPEARYWLGALAHRLGDADRAAEIWRALVDELPEDRWAWRAAGTLTGTAFSVGSGARLDWGGAELLDAQRTFAPQPLAAADAGRARGTALAWLLATQRSDGSWATPSESQRFTPEEPDDLLQAAASICGTALIARRDDPAAAAALDRALAYALEAHAAALAAEDRPYFMDYEVWSRAYLVAFLAECAAAGVGERDALASTVETAVEELAFKQKRGGGWSYYVTGDLDSGAPPAEQSISFTTAAVVLGLLKAHEAGFDVPEQVLERGLDCLESMRNPDGTFAYMLLPGQRGPTGAPIGAAGRGPVCALALYRGGRGSLGEIRARLAHFVEHKDALAAEIGKGLMHCGPGGLSSHYPYFDYATAAAAVAELPEGEQVKYRDVLVEEIMRGRSVEGSFRDNLLLGWATGTGLALQALQSLAP